MNDVSGWAFFRCESIVAWTIAGSIFIALGSMWMSAIALLIVALIGLYSTVRSAR